MILVLHNEVNGLFGYICQALKNVMLESLIAGQLKVGLLLVCCCFINISVLIIVFCGPKERDCVDMFEYRYYSLFTLCQEQVLVYSLPILNNRGKHIFIHIFEIMDVELSSKSLISISVFKIVSCSAISWCLCACMRLYAFHFKTM